MIPNFYGLEVSLSNMIGFFCSSNMMAFFSKTEKKKLQQTLKGPHIYNIHMEREGVAES